VRSPTSGAISDASDRDCRTSFSDSLRAVFGRPGWRVSAHQGHYALEADDGDQPGTSDGTVVLP
jgi:hypothetical protein